MDHSAGQREHSLSLRERARVRGKTTSGGQVGSDSSRADLDDIGSGQPGHPANNLDLQLSQVLPETIQVRSNRPGLSGPLSAFLDTPPFRFEPHFGWKGFVECSI